MPIVVPRINCQNPTGGDPTKPCENFNRVIDEINKLVPLIEAKANGAGVLAVLAGAGIEIDSTNKNKPIVSSTAIKEKDGKPTVTEFKNGKIKVFVDSKAGVFYILKNGKVEKVGGGNTGVTEVKEGKGVKVDNTDPLKPIISTKPCCDAVARIPKPSDFKDNINTVTNTKTNIKYSLTADKKDVTAEKGQVFFHANFVGHCPSLSEGQCVSLTPIQTTWDAINAVDGADGIPIINMGGFKLGDEVAGEKSKLRGGKTIQVPTKGLYLLTFNFIATTAGRRKYPTVAVTTFLKIIDKVTGKSLAPPFTVGDTGQIQTFKKYLVFLDPSEKLVFAVEKFDYSKDVNTPTVIQNSINPIIESSWIEYELIKEIA